MYRVLLVLLVACSANAATYRGIVRSEAWVDRSYLHFRTRVASVEGKWVDVSWPKRYVTELPPLSAARIHCRPRRETPDGLLISVAAHDPREVSAASAKRTPNAKPGHFGASCQQLLLVGGAAPDKGATLTFTVAAVSRDDTGVYRCVVVPKNCEPLTRQQFLNVLASGFRLYEWRETRERIGSGSIPVYRKRYVP